MEFHRKGKRLLKDESDNLQCLIEKVRIMNGHFSHQCLKVCHEINKPAK